MMRLMSLNVSFIAFMRTVHLGFQNYHDIKQGTLLTKVDLFIPQILSLCSKIDFDNTRGQRKGVYTLFCQKKLLYM
jgi:hypothetical protein